MTGRREEAKTSMCYLGEWLDIFCEALAELELGGYACTLGRGNCDPRCQRRRMFAFL